jgi:polysaccharide export outer membrane protein
MQEPDRYIPSYADTLSFEDYVLRIGDRLYVYVYSTYENVQKMYNAGGANSSQMRQQMGNGALGGSYDLYTYLIDEEGNIDFPTIGKIYVQGMTTRDVKHKLEEELGTLLKEIPGYSTISVEVNIVNRSFSIIGAQSGRYMINKEKMTIFEALALAGDLGEFNSRKEIKFVREKNGVTTLKTFDARSKDLVNSEYYYIEPNDIIYIRQIPGYSFGINHVTTVIGVTAATISFGVFIYSIVQTGINHVNKYYGKKSSSTTEGGAI